MHRSRLPLLAVLVTGALAACGTSPAPVEVQSTALVPASTTTPSPSTSAPTSSSTTTPSPSTSAPAPTFPTRPLEWKPCEEDGLECATLTVPLDYSDPTGDTIELALVRHPAGDRDGRIGSLLVNPGGPGVPGTMIARQADLYFADELLDRFDIVGWDPRGTGASSPVDCDDNLDPYLTLDPSPDSQSEKEALIESARAFARACTARSGRLLPHVSTLDSVRDMEQIRKALGEDKISYFGFSYGSELGATFATMFPQSVRAMVLDGAVNPNSDRTEQARQQVTGLEHSLDRFLDDCAQSPRCAFHNGGESAAAFDRLLANLDAHPLDLDGRQIGQGVAYTAIISALYSRQTWPLLAESLSRAQEGDATGLAFLYDEYVSRDDDGHYANVFEALIAINCLDDPGPTELGFSDQLAVEFAQLAPRLGRASAYGYFCTFWPARPTEDLTVTGAGAGPIVVVGTTGDPITPLETSRQLADTLEQGVLVTVDGEQHTGYRLNRCVNQAVHRYLIDGEVPAEGLVC